MANVRKRDNPGGLFIPAGLLTGMGIGFIFDNIPAGMFVGLGLGFVVFAITSLIFVGTDKKEEE